MGALLSARKRLRGHFVLACALASLLAVSVARTESRPAADKELRIGSSGTLTGPGNEKGAIKSLEDFIKEETGLNNTIVKQKTWRELADRMVKGELQIGVFQGYEFAWAQEKHPELKPLALSVNITRYPVVYVVVQKSNPVKDFAGLQGQSLCIPATGQGYLRLYVDRQAQAQGKKADDFFSKITSKETVEEALDDVVDGVMQAAAIDKAGLDGFKRRKPGRFNQLKEVAQSQPFPPVVVAYTEKSLDEATVRRFRDGLLNASRKEKGRTMLTLFRMTGFESVPADFDKVLADTRKNYPPEDEKK
jgi:ABC-type phosphate/phosphonate transport system substrate-binding protein